jgi:hypothetical protein
MTNKNKNITSVNWAENDELLNYAISSSADLLLHKIEQAETLKTESNMGLLGTDFLSNVSNAFNKYCVLTTLVGDPTTDQKEIITDANTRAKNLFGEDLWVQSIMTENPTFLNVCRTKLEAYEVIDFLIDFLKDTLIDKIYDLGKGDKKMFNAIRDVAAEFNTLSIVMELKGVNPLDYQTKKIYGIIMTAIKHFGFRNWAMAINATASSYYDIATNDLFKLGNN